MIFASFFFFQSGFCGTAFVCLFQLVILNSGAFANFVVIELWKLEYTIIYCNRVLLVGLFNSWSFLFLNGWSK
jgi:hypothetical protein